MKRRPRTDATLEVVIEPRAVASDRRGVLTVLERGVPGTVVPIGDDALVVGRTDEAHFVLEDGSLSRKHARFFRAHGTYFVEDLGSTNGTFVDGTRVRAPRALIDGARVQLGAAVVRFTLRDDAEVEATRKMYESSVRDPLTGVYNRLYVDERLSAEMSYAKRHGTELAVLFVDADHFKQVNDRHGHAAGDLALRAIASFLEESLRSEDIVARYGGEEFVLVIRGVPMSSVLLVAERLRAGVQALAIRHEGHVIGVTISIGVASQSATRDHESVAALIAAADAALYRAKAEGRNRVVFA